MGKRKKTKIPSISPTQLPEEKPSIIRREVKIQGKASFHQGPLPMPQILAQYNQVLPGAAERIVAMAETQAGHRQNLESMVIQSDIKNSRIGLIFGFIIGMTAIILGAISVLNGQTIGGSVIGTGGISGLVGVFVYGSRQRRRERERKFEIEANASKSAS